MKSDTAADLAVYIGIIRGKFVVFPNAYNGNMRGEFIGKGHGLGRLRGYYIAI